MACLAACMALHAKVLIASFYVALGGAFCGLLCEEETGRSKTMGQREGKRSEE